ncbi:hypothetical protein HHI36_021708 [Cryptolaemus montrouzieri]|uniref:Uncharacterized protein n=1 Tax=Cryptolaemus montrouzieri TaxID=559131 RepID=A0ABD2MYK0_9CUCU
MNSSYLETAETSEFTKLEDKSFVNQFIDTKGKFWERNSFIEPYVENFGRQAVNLCKNLPKIEPEQPEESFLEKKIFIKYEGCEDTTINNESNKAIIPKIEAESFEEDIKTIKNEHINDGNKWLQGSM